ncbi:MAG: hypothetical protein KAJ49_03175 [Arcobacteraceae bacterium]|nr:hypothetical protein [Arcobacteraceae bacterium]
MDYNEDDDLPKRTDPIYKEIADFKDYELTHCVVHEMTIRNKNVIEILEKIDYIAELKDEHQY